MDDGGSGSVMAEMMALVAPPGRDSKRNAANGLNNLLNPQPVELHPYFKRPGKGHNHDCCDACGEGGDLICCDNCPASFHFSCHAPPLEEEDIPKGEWVCLSCFVRQQKRSDTSNAFKSNPLFQTCSGDEKTSSLPSTTSGKRGGRHSRACKKQQEKTIKAYKIKYEKYLKPRPPTNSPFDNLIAATQIINAKEFKLPPELESKESLPFSWKWSDEKQDDLNQFPKNCTNCSKTSRNIPSISCDFCPCVYHLDCLNPPLCEIPKERWMCPNHVEHFIDSKLLTSTRLSERLYLWKKYARSQVNPEAVKMDFLRKARRGSLFSRNRIKTPMSHRIKVPQNVKDQYRSPLPSNASEFKPIKRSDEGSQKEFISQLISMQMSVLKDQNNELMDLEEANEQKKRLKFKKKLTNGNDKSDKDKENTESDATLSDCSLDLDSDEEDGICLTENLHEELITYLAKNKKHGLRNINPTVRNYLALTKLKELFPERKIDITSEVQARAAVVSLNTSSKTPSLMRYRTLSIGYGPDCDLNLLEYGHCNYVSSRHAKIYFDQYTYLYELINYSEHGSLIDNVVYSLNIRPLNTTKLTKGEHLHVMSQKSGEKKCHCEKSIAKMLTNTQGCEGSAVLHHGSYIRFGCLEFTFSIMDFKQNIDPLELRKSKTQFDTKDSSETKDIDIFTVNNQQDNKNQLESSKDESIDESNNIVNTDNTST